MSQKTLKAIDEFIKREEKRIGRAKVLADRMQRNDQGWEYNLDPRITNASGDLSQDLKTDPVYVKIESMQKKNYFHILDRFLYSMRERKMDQETYEFLLNHSEKEIMKQKVWGRKR